jgi:hypothetical protein
MFGKPLTINLQTTSASLELNIELKGDLVEPISQITIRLVLTPPVDNDFTTGGLLSLFFNVLLELFIAPVRSEREAFQVATFTHLFKLVV